MRRRAVSDEKPAHRVGFAVLSEGCQSEGSSPRVRLPTPQLMVPQPQPVVPHLPSLLAQSICVTARGGTHHRAPEGRVEVEVGACAAASALQSDLLSESDLPQSDLLSHEEGSSATFAALVSPPAFANTTAPAPPASPSPDSLRRAAALGVSPRGTAPRRCRYSNPRYPGAFKLASLGLHGSLREAEARGVAAYPSSSAVAARLGPLAAFPPLSKADWDGQRRGQRLSMQGVQSQATELFRLPRRASAADRECYASAEVRRVPDPSTISLPYSLPSLLTFSPSPPLPFTPHSSSLNLHILITSLNRHHTLNLPSNLAPRPPSHFTPTPPQPYANTE